MDATTVYRLISLVPDRTARAPSGSAFELQDGHSARIALLMRFLHWLGPLDALSKEDQQALGVRSGGGRSMGPDEEELDGEPLADEVLADELPRFEDDPDPAPVRPSEAGTQIAA